MAGPAYALEEAALLKVLLHAAKFPASPVNGLLLGEVAGEGAGRRVLIRDALPLFHGFLALAPALETALCQAQAYAQTTERLSLVGYYHANERLGDLELGGVARRIADRVREGAGSPAACALLVDNSKLAAFLEHEAVDPLQLWTREGGGGWSRAPARRLELRPAGAPEASSSPPGAGPSRALERQLARHQQCRLHDFDDHLGDIRKDWLNRDLLG